MKNKKTILSKMFGVIISFALVVGMLFTGAVVNTAKAEVSDNGGRYIYYLYGFTTNSKYYDSTEGKYKTDILKEETKVTNILLAKAMYEAEDNTPDGLTTDDKSEPSVVTAKGVFDAIWGDVFAAPHAVLDRITNEIKPLLDEGHTLTYSDKDVFDSVMEDYDKLDQNQQDYVGRCPEWQYVVELSGKLDDLTGYLDQLAQDIYDLPGEDVKYSDKEALESVEERYGALEENSEDKAYVDNKVAQLGNQDKTVENIATTRTAFDALVAELNQLVSDINNLPCENVKYSDKEALESVESRYAALEESAKAYVNENATEENIATTRTAFNALVAELNQLVSDINNLPCENVKYSDKEALESVESRYAALEESAKAYVDENATEENIATTRTAYDALKAKLDEVVAVIKALPKPADVTVSHKNQIEEADKKYNDAVYVLNVGTQSEEKVLDQTRVDYIASELAALENVEDEEEAAKNAGLTTRLPDDLAALKAITDRLDVVVSAIKALPKPADVTLADATKIHDAEKLYKENVRVPAENEEDVYGEVAYVQAALAALENVEDEEEAAKNAGLQTRLPDDLNALARIAQDLDKLAQDIYDLPGKNVTIKYDVEELEDVEERYDELPADSEEKTYVDNKVKELGDKDKTVGNIDTTRTTYDALVERLDAVVAAIEELPVPAEVTLADEDDIVNARELYDAVVDADEKAYVDAALTEKELTTRLPDDEAALAAIKERLDAVVEVIKALPKPEDVTILNKEQIEAADALYKEKVQGDDEEAYVQAALQALEEVEDEEEAAANEGLHERLPRDLEELKKITDRLDAVVEAIKALPKPADVTLEDKEQIEYADKLYNTYSEDEDAGVKDADEKDYVDAKLADESSENEEDDNYGLTTRLPDDLEKLKYLELAQRINEIVDRYEDDNKPLNDNDYEEAEKILDELKELEDDGKEGDFKTTTNNTDDDYEYAKDILYRILASTYFKQAVEELQTEVNLANLGTTDEPDWQANKVKVELTDEEDNPLTNDDGSNVTQFITKRGYYTVEGYVLEKALLAMYNDFNDKTKQLVHTAYQKLLVIDEAYAFELDKLDNYNNYFNKDEINDKLETLVNNLNNSVIEALGYNPTEVTSVKVAFENALEAIETDYEDKINALNNAIIAALGYIPEEGKDATVADAYAAAKKAIEDDYVAKIKALRDEIIAALGYTPEEGKEATVADAYTAAVNKIMNDVSEKYDGTISDLETRLANVFTDLFNKLDQDNNGYDSALRAKLEDIIRQTFNKQILAGFKNTLTEEYRDADRTLETKLTTAYQNADKQLKKEIEDELAEMKKMFTIVAIALGVVIVALAACVVVLFIKKNRETGEKYLISDDEQGNE